MPLTDIQQIQRDTLALFPQGADGVSPGNSASFAGISCPAAAETLGIRAGTVRQRLIRYERDGFLERSQLQDGQGFEYRITPRGITRLNWLRAQEPAKPKDSTLLWLGLIAGLSGLAYMFWKRRQRQLAPTVPPEEEKS